MQLRAGGPPLLPGTPMLAPLLFARAIMWHRSIETGILRNKHTSCEWVMAESIILDQETLPDRGAPGPQERFWAWLSLAILALLVICALLMYFYRLGQPIERDFDEGVYWQSLHAMQSGYQLYQQIFYSQPPFFLLSAYPLFALLGGSLWAARVSVALWGLVGLLGAILLGHALRGRLGAIVAALLTLTNVTLLAEARVLQADGPSVALACLAVGLAFTWASQPASARGRRLLLAGLTGLVLALALMYKLLAVPALAPCALLVAGDLWQAWNSAAADRGERRRRSGQILLQALLALLVACLCILLLVLPFLGSYRAMLDGVFTFHTQAAPIFRTLRQNAQMVLQALCSLLALCALCGALLALLRRDWRFLPLLAWLLATVAMLIDQAPLLPHHFVALVPPLVALAVLGMGEPALLLRSLPRFRPALLLDGLALLLLLLTLGQATLGDVHYYAHPPAAASPALELQAARDLQRTLTPDQLVITDEPFVAVLADRGTPPMLVDTSTVRIRTGYLSLHQLIVASLQPQVGAVLFFSGRFYLKPVAGFHAWVAQHFHLLRTYGPGQELWVRT